MAVVATGTGEMVVDPLSISVAQRLPVTVVVLEGRLGLESVGRLRQSLIKRLVACPDALVIDVARLTVDSDLPLTVFRVVSRHAANWPAVPVVLAAPSPDVAERLIRTGLDASLPMHGSRAEAIMKAIGPPTVARADWDIVSGPNSASQARTLIAEVCRAWGLAGVLDTVLVVVSELVTNAVVHASGSVHVTVLLRRSQLHVVVRDQNPDPPRRLEPRLRSTTGVSLALNGRGIPLLDSMCRSWGHLSSDTGKAVWAMVDVTAPAGRA